MNDTANPMVFVVDDDDAVRDSLMFLLESVGLQGRSFASAQAFLDAYGDERGVLVLDVRMPAMSGLELQEILIERGAPVCIVFISGHADIEMAVKAVKRGASDFLTKPYREQELLDRVHAVLDESGRALREQRRRQEILDRIDSLTGREREVMAMVADGKANKVIAMDLDISQRTVEVHRSNVMQKMEVRSLAQLIRYLNDAGFFDSSSAAS